MIDRECLRTSTNVWRSLCDHCELMANCIRKPIRHTFATGETSITFETPQKDRECLRTATNVWRSFAIITNSWRTALVSPFAIYSPQCETSIIVWAPLRPAEISSQSMFFCLFFNRKQQVMRINHVSDVLVPQPSSWRLCDAHHVTSSSSTGILRSKRAVHETNCNRSFFNGFGSNNVSPITY